ncbi:MAG: type II toxin-antitoxin system PemK/MazF family toxin [Desulfitobacterium hafniense]
MLCQITSQNVRDNYAITFENQDMNDGKLDKISNVRPNRLFTADHHIVLYRIGSLAPTKMQEVIERLIEIITHE